MQTGVPESFSPSFTMPGMIQDDEANSNTIAGQLDATSQSDNVVPKLELGSDDERMNESTGSKPSYRRAKSRATRACEVCHTRKVRCDVTFKKPCTNCAAFGCECVIPAPKRRKLANKKNAHNSEEKQSVWEDSDPAPSTDVPVAVTDPAETHNTGSFKPINGKQPGKPSKKIKLSGSLPNDGTDAIADGSKKSNGDTISASAIRYASNNNSTLEDVFRPGPSLEQVPDAEHNPAREESWMHLLGTKSVRAGRVAFLGSSSNVNLLMDDSTQTDTYHYNIPDDISSGGTRLNELDSEEIEILKLRGAFLLPPRDLCDDLVEAYFYKIHPMIPIVNRNQFMRRYNDPSNPPSLLLLQAILLAGSRVCHNPALLDATGSAELASLTFYKRVKSLYDANYETDRISIVQSLVLMGWWWEGPEDVTKNVFYWTRVALCVAQGFGLHRSVEKSSMSVQDKRTWKRIWWSIFVRDRSVAVALGRPMAANLEDSDVPMITEDDLIEDEAGFPSPYPINRVHSLYFIHLVKLSEIMGLILRQQFSVGAENQRRQHNLPVVSHCDMAMGAWMNNLPPELKYSVKDQANHNFHKALLHSQYYTTLCLVHRSNILHRKTNNSQPYPSWGIAFQAAHMITKIMGNMLAHNELRDCPAFVVYTIFSAMIMLVYQTESPSPQVVESAEKALKTCLEALREIGKTWMVGRMILKLFIHMNENQQIRDRVVKSARNSSSIASANINHYKIHTKSNKANGKTTKSSQRPNVSNVGVFPGGGTHQTEPFDLGVAKGTEIPGFSQPISYERSRPATPSETNPGRKSPVLGNNHDGTSNRHLDNNNNANDTNYHAPDSDSYLPGTSWGGTAPSTPFNPVLIPPKSGPDFFFVTNTPPISHQFVENFQPNQLFPDATNSGRSTGTLGSDSEGGLANETGPLSVDGGSKSSPESINGTLAPNSLNIGDWYHFMVSNNGGEIPELSDLGEQFLQSAE